MRPLSANKEMKAEFILQQLNPLHLELGGCIEFRLNGVQLHTEMFLVHLDSVATFPLNLLFDQHLVVAKEWGVKIENMDVREGVHIRSSALHFDTRDRKKKKIKHWRPRLKRKQEKNLIPAAPCEKDPSASSCTGQSLPQWSPGFSGAHWCHWRWSKDEEHVVEKQHYQDETSPNICFSKFVSSIPQWDKTWHIPLHVNFKCLENAASTRQMRFSPAHDVRRSHGIFSLSSII